MAGAVHLKHDPWESRERDESRRGHDEVDDRIAEHDLQRRGQGHSSFLSFGKRSVRARPELLPPCSGLDMTMLF
jgi:hypothetical protein